VPRAALERLAREIPPDRESFERVLALQPWRLWLVAEPIWRMLRGEAVLKIEGYATGDPKVRLVDEPHPNSFSALDSLRAGDRTYGYFRLDALESRGIGKLSRLPFFAQDLARELAPLARMDEP